MALQIVKETAISFIVQAALDKVWSLLQNRIGLFRGAENHLEKIRDSLVEIRDFIVIAEGSPKKDPKLMELLEKLKDAAYDAEDLLEENEIAGRRWTEEAESTVRAVVASVSSPITMVKKLQKLSESLEAIKAECDTFQLKEKVTKFEIEFKELRETHSFVHKSEVIGRDREKEEIVTLLLSTELDAASVIAIVGIGGLGKTTLAQSVFNDDAVQNHFQPKMWICVSDNLEPDNFNIKRLGNKILERAIDDHHNLSDLEKLQSRLRKELDGKRFLLVLDDVWNENRGKWHGKNGLRDLLLCGGRGSRIVVTTRSRKVASIMSKIEPYRLKPLSEDGCRSLFFERAFGNPTEEAAPPKLALIGREIVEKCGGIPLAVTTLGGLLCSERSQRKWEFVRDSEMWNLDDENENGILPALRLSYNHLKPHLKQCFAFCAIFPQDYVMKKELVIKLWMAQGFIPTKRGMELEDTGDEIFDELVMKSFFQEVNAEVNNASDRIWTSFQMHDLMHDLAQSVMENECLVNYNGMSKDISPRIRHVSSSRGILPTSLRKAQMLRTYVMFKRPGIQIFIQSPCDVGLFKCLRALDFMSQRNKQKVEKQLLTSLGSLQHLRYLNLSFSLIEMLPESLTSLCYLQTLILSGCRELCELPKEMCKLTNLRCLDISHCNQLTHMPPNMGRLSCLQELSNFIVGRTNEIACSGIGELQGLNLRGHLEIRFLENATDAIDVPRDTLINFPCWMMDTLTKLVVIKLSGFWRCNHLPPLGELPYLKILEIGWFNNVECIGNEFYGNEVSGGFPSLKKLYIHHMQKLKTWSVLKWKGERAFPSLVKMNISCCRMLTTLEFFPYIKDLNVDQGMMQSFKNLKLFKSMHQQNCNQSSFADEDQIRSQSALQYLDIMSCDNLIFSSLGLRYLNSLEWLSICKSNEFAHVAHELSFLTRLTVLYLTECHGLKSLPGGIMNLTSLRELQISNCPEMSSLPKELQRLSALELFSIYGCHPSLEIQCTKRTGEDWDNIQHIPKINIGGSLYRKR